MTRLSPALYPPSRKGFDPLLPDTMVPFGDLDALERELRKGDVAALLIEPIQGKGVNITPDGFLRDAQVLLKGHGALLIADEVQGKGTVDHTPVYPREVIRRALELSATAIILVHNHPSGDPTPSRADISMTETIVGVDPDICR